MSARNRKAFWAARSRELPFNTKAHRKWGKQAAWIHGEGPYASLCYCPSGGSHGDTCLTIQLCETLEEALQAQFNLICGGNCYDPQDPNRTDWHQIWDLSARGFKRVTKPEYVPEALDESEIVSADVEGVCQ